MLLAVGGCIAMAGAMGIGRFIYTPILPPMAQDLGLTQGQAGLIAAANFLGYLAGALAAALGRLPGSPRGWLLAALAVSAATTGAMGWDAVFGPPGAAWGLIPFLLLRFLGGAASALVLVFASTLVLERLGAAGRGGLAAVHFAGVGVGIALSALLTWGLVAAGSGWQALWLGGGGLSLAGLVAVAWLVPGAARGAGGATTAPAGAGARLWPLVTAYGLFGFGYIITATFIVAIVRAAPRDGGADLAAIEPLVWLVVGLAAVPSVALWTALGRRYGVLPVFAAACLVEAAGVLASVLWISAPGLLLAAALLGGTFMGLTALGLIAARERVGGAGSGSAPRRAIAAMTAAFGLGQMIGPLVAGYGFDLTGSFLLPSLIATAALAAAAGLVLRLQR